MTRPQLYLFCLGLSLNPLTADAVDTKTIESERMMGSYSSVTESECNIRLRLIEHGKAKIIQTCRLEDGSHRDVTEEKYATWSFDGDQIFIKYDGVTDAFHYRTSVPYAEFGGQGAGPGLERVGAPHSKSRLEGYGQIWKEPIRSNNGG